MTSADGRFVIIFNGEIYNFIELRIELEKLGGRFSSDGDTEVLLEAWRLWGKAMLPKLNGMWSIAIYDNEARRLFLARDRFGIKPLYYSLSPQGLAFASEIRALRSILPLGDSFDGHVIRRTIFDPFSIEASERTLYSAVRRLPAGHLAEVCDGSVKIERWWWTLHNLPKAPATFGEQAEAFREIFLDAVHLRMRSDVSIGTCLSGGFDSTAVVCAMNYAAKKHAVGTRETEDWRSAFIASFPGKPNDETPFALEAAEFASARTKVIPVNDDLALQQIDQILQDMEDVYISLPTAVWQTYKALRSDRTVVSLDGHGADELMGGYVGVRSWRYLANSLTHMRAMRGPIHRRGLDALKSSALNLAGLNFLRNHRTSAPEAIETPFDRDLDRSEFDLDNRRFYKMFHIEILPMILRNFDRMSMAHGIEVRMPFLDWRLVTFIMSLPSTSKLRDGQSKVVAREALTGLMPENIRTSRTKVGFNSPMPQWLNGPLGKWSLEVISGPIAGLDEFVDVPALRKRVAQLNADSAWDWTTSNRLWPYIHMAWRMSH